MFSEVLDLKLCVVDRGSVVGMLGTIETRTTRAASTGGGPHVTGSLGGRE